VAIDSAAVYASALRTPGLLPNATIVVDHFHLVRLANVALSRVRRRVTWELRALLSTVRVGGDPHLTRHRLHRFVAWCVDSQIPELLALAKTVDVWWPEVHAFVRTGIINARTEGYNRLGKQGKRAGCGYRNPHNSARRIRFHCTRPQRAAAATFC
jgi:transposase